MGNNWILFGIGLLGGAVLGTIASIPFVVEGIPSSVILVIGGGTLSGGLLLPLMGLLGSRRS